MTDLAEPYEIQADDGIPVLLPSGANHYVLTDGEARELRDKCERYLSDNHFVNVADMQEIDRMIIFELMIYRWNLWISRGKDYWNEDVDPKKYHDMVNVYSKEVRLIKKALGLDKSTRDRTRGDNSVAALWDNLLQRAKEFGYMRNEQYVQVITSFQRIKAMITLHKNTDLIERKENACELSDVLEVIEEEIAKFDAIDEKFRFETQRLWVRKQ